MRYPVAALGVTQIIGYGTLFYAFPITVPAVADDFGLPQDWLYAAFSAGLLAGGLAAPWAGRAMDRLGAARLMTGGSAAAALLLALLAGLPLGPWGFVGLIVALELVAVCVLYDAAFATLATLRGAGARRAITRLTLIAGFASTLFWPLTGWLVEALGWRGTYGSFAVLHLALALPLHAALARSRPDPAAQPADTPPVRAASASGPASGPVAGPVLTPARAPATPPALPPEQVRNGFLLLAASFTLSGMLIAAIGVHMVPLLQALALGSMAYLVAMVMGPAQVAIRVVEALLWQRYHPVTVALISAACLPLAVLILLAAPTEGQGQIAAALAFAALFGAGQGLASIVRGSVPLALFGPRGYGAMLGRLASVRQIAAALAPLGFAVLLTRVSPQAGLWVATGFGLAGLVPMLALSRLLRPPAPAPVPPL